MKYLGFLICLASLSLFGCNSLPINTDYQSIRLKVGEERTVNILNFDKPDNLRINLSYQKASIGRSIFTSPENYIEIRREGSRLFIKGIQTTGVGYFVQVNLASSDQFFSRAGFFTVVVD